MDPLLRKCLFKIKMFLIPQECDFEGRPVLTNTSGPVPTAPSSQCYLLFTGLEHTGHHLGSLRVTAHFGVDAVHKVGKVTLPVQTFSNGRAYAAVFYPSMQEIWPELYNTANIRVVEVRSVSSIVCITHRFQNLLLFHNV